MLVTASSHEVLRISMRALTQEKDARHVIDARRHLRNVRGQLYPARVDELSAILFEVLSEQIRG